MKEVPISSALLRNRSVCAKHSSKASLQRAVGDIDRAGDMREPVVAGAKTPHHAKMLAFLPRCSNSRAVFAIPAGTVYDIATHSRLGGQHGEEAKEDGEGSEEGREKDEAPEKEVTTRRFSVFDFERRR